MSRTSPIVLRSGHTYNNWKSHWYGDNNYTQLLTEDLKIRYYVNNVHYYLKFPSSDLNIRRRQNRISLLHQKLFMPEYTDTSKLNSFLFYFHRLENHSVKKNLQCLKSHSLIKFSILDILIKIILGTYPNNKFSPILNNSVITYLLKSFFFQKVNVFGFFYHFQLPNLMIKNFEHAKISSNLVFFNRKLRLEHSISSFFKRILFEKKISTEFFNLKHGTLNLFKSVNIEDLSSAQKHRKYRLNIVKKSNKRLHTTNSIVMLDSFGKKYYYRPQDRKDWFPHYDFIAFFKTNFFSLIKVYTGFHLFVRRKKIRKRTFKTFRKKILTKNFIRLANKILRLKNNLSYLIKLSNILKSLLKCYKVASVKDRSLFPNKNKAISNKFLNNLFINKYNLDIIKNIKEVINARLLKKKTYYKDGNRDKKFFKNKKFYFNNSYSTKNKRNRLQISSKKVRANMRRLLQLVSNKLNYHKSKRKVKPTKHKIRMRIPKNLTKIFNSLNHKGYPNMLFHKFKWLTNLVTKLFVAKRRVVELIEYYWQLAKNLSKVIKANYNPRLELGRRYFRRVNPRNYIYECFKNQWLRFKFRENFQNSFYFITKNATNFKKRHFHPIVLWLKSVVSFGTSFFNFSHNVNRFFMKRRISLRKLARISSYKVRLKRKKPKKIDKFDIRYIPPFMNKNLKFFFNKYRRKFKGFKRRKSYLPGFIILKKGKLKFPKKEIVKRLSRYYKHNKLRNHLIKLKNFKNQVLKYKRRLIPKASSLSSLKANPLSKIDRIYLKNKFLYKVIFRMIKKLVLNHYKPNINLMRSLKKLRQFSKRRLLNKEKSMRRIDKFRFISRKLRREYPSYFKLYKKIFWFPINKTKRKLKNDPKFFYKSLNRRLPLKITYPEFSRILKKRKIKEKSMNRHYIPNKYNKNHYYKDREKYNTRKSSFFIKKARDKALINRNIRKKYFKYKTKYFTLYVYNALRKKISANNIFSVNRNYQEVPKGRLLFISSHTKPLLRAFRKINSIKNRLRTGKVQTFKFKKYNTVNTKKLNFIPRGNKYYNKTARNVSKRKVFKSKTIRKKINVNDISKHLRYHINNTILTNSLKLINAFGFSRIQTKKLKHFKKVLLSPNKKQHALKTSKNNNFLKKKKSIYLFLTILKLVLKKLISKPLIYTNRKFNQRSKIKPVLHNHKYNHKSRSRLRYLRIRLQKKSFFKNLNLKQNKLVYNMSFIRLFVNNVNNHIKHMVVTNFNEKPSLKKTKYLNNLYNREYLTSNFKYGSFFLRNSKNYNYSIHKVENNYFRSKVIKSFILSYLKRSKFLKEKKFKLSKKNKVVSPSKMKKILDIPLSKPSFKKVLYVNKQNLKEYDKVTISAILGSILYTFFRKDIYNRLEGIELSKKYSIKKSINKRKKLLMFFKRMNLLPSGMLTSNALRRKKKRKKLKIKYSNSFAYNSMIPDNINLSFFPYKVTSLFKYLSKIKIVLNNLIQNFHRRILNFIDSLNTLKTYPHNFNADSYQFIFQFIFFFIHYLKRWVKSLLMFIDTNNILNLLTFTKTNSLSKIYRVKNNIVKNTFYTWNKYSYFNLKLKFLYNTIRDLAHKKRKTHDQKNTSDMFEIKNIDLSHKKEGTTFIEKPLKSMNSIGNYLNRDFSNYIQLNYVMEYDINKLNRSKENFLYFYNLYKYNYDYNCMFLLSPRLLCDYFVYSIKNRVQYREVFFDIRQASSDLFRLKTFLKKYYDKILYLLLHRYVDYLTDWYFFRVKMYNGDFTLANLDRYKLILAKKTSILLKLFSYACYLIDIRNHANVAGINIRTSGRRSRKLRTHARLYQRGPMSLNTFSDNIDYYFKPVTSKFGTLGVKVFLYREPFHKIPLYQIMYETLFLRFKSLRNMLVSIHYEKK
uniref:Ribosomal protein S3 n=1 Tax=Pharyngomonas kirbyi TaxID=63601 RepID=A0A1W6R274_9EUKA|nr:ribosomal protein S3 [Pharyngomonas kirbyi]ARO47980.1 ribosomal protein S3 [Pharyngomonas kirbyi]